MGCRCCKMLQSYLFDPVQVPSPGYVNEVSSCKVDEDDTVKLKGKQSSEVLVHRNDLPSEDAKKTASRSRTAGPLEPCWPHGGPLLQGDPGGSPCAEKAGGAVNGIGPTAALQLTGDPAHPQGDGGSWASTANGVRPTQPYLEGGRASEPDRVLPASEETRVIPPGDSRAPPKAEHPAREAQDHVLQIPAPDYPRLRGSAEDNADHGEQDCLFKNRAEEEPREGVQPRAGDHGMNIPFSVKRSWDSLNEAVATEVLNVYFKEEDPAQDVPVGDSRNGLEESPGSSGDRSGGLEAEEDAEVAEALAALEAATAGEDVDEAD
ncbi:PDCD10 and GCKIII kinases-associated protein 1 [Camelus bactrianus]|uniref:PDCD10 and GCKIII kinases-associated protein 1 n=2 Tax=Camelus bactrianus TaxID=9837 RepID=A0A9W3GXW0_CAMBA